jgi:hypothetical protein
MTDRVEELNPADRERLARIVQTVGAATGVRIAERSSVDELERELACQLGLDVARFEPSAPSSVGERLDRLERALGAGLWLDVPSSDGASPPKRTTSSGLRGLLGGGR